MKIKVIEKDGRDMIELTPIPNKLTKNGIKKKHYSYDAWLDILPGVKYYPLNNKESMDRVVIDACHGGGSQILGEEEQEDIRKRHEDGESMFSIRKDLNASPHIIKKIVKN